MAMSSEITAHLVVSSDELDFSGCTAAVGIVPTKTWTRPYPYSSDVIPRKQWIFGIEKKGYVSTSDAVAELFRQIGGKEERIRSFALERRCRVTVVCDVTIHEDRPLYELTSEQISNLARLGARFLMDVFDYSSGQ